MKENGTLAFLKSAKCFVIYDARQKHVSVGAYAN